MRKVFFVFFIQYLLHGRNDVLLLLLLFFQQNSILIFCRLSSDIQNGTSHIKNKFEDACK